MTIETKYNINEYVWVNITESGEGCEGRKPEPDCLAIRSIEFNKMDGVAYTTDKYRCPCCRSRFLEKECFKTKEELLQSL